MLNSTEVNEESGLDLFVRLRTPWLLLKLNFCDAVNEVLNGGVVRGEITELVGSLAVGKTQVLRTTRRVAFIEGIKCCLSIIASFLCNEKCSNTFVLYIDTNGSFRSSRLLKIITGNKILEEDAVKLLSRVLVCYVYSENELKQVLIDVQDRKEAISLIVIDSIGIALSQTTVNYLEGGREVQEEIIARLHCLIDKLNCAVLTTNHLVYWKEKPTPSLGKKWLNSVHTRYLLAKLSDCWYIQMIHSRRFELNDQRALYTITDHGIQDLNDSVYNAEQTQAMQEIISQNWDTVMQAYSQDLDNV
uniref:Rad51 domain-containing protein n=1 Tax=Syphacia muris TaxID=451379 RepID=A0A0N5AGN3_9BILA